MLAVIGIPVAASCTSDARGLVECVRDSINRKFKLTGPTDNGLRPSFGNPAPKPPPSVAPVAEPVAEAVAEPAAEPVAQPMSKLSVGIVESASASEPPAAAVRSADLSPEMAPAPRPDPVVAAQPALPALPEAEPVGSPASSGKPASVAPAPRLPEGWPIYTEAPLPPSPASSLAVAPMEPSAPAVLPETPLALPEAVPAPEPPVPLPEPPVPLPKTIATSAPPSVLAPAPPSLPPEFPLQMAAATPVAPPASPQVTGLPVLAPTIDAIQIEGDSNFVAGTGPEGTRVRLYINDRLIDDSEVIEGRWLIEGVNLLDSPSSVLRIEAFDPATGAVLGTASVSVEIELPADAAPIAPPAPAPATPAPATPPPADPPAAPVSVVPAEPVVAPEPVNDQQAEAVPAPPPPPIPAARPTKAPAAKPAAIPRLTPITPRKSSASVSVLPFPKVDAYPTLRPAGSSAPSVQTLN